MTAVIRGIQYHYEYIKSDSRLPVLVMLHGFMGSSASFSHLTDALRPSANILLLDLIGHGKSDAPSSPSRYHTGEQVRDIKELLAGYPDSSVFLLGYSMGGRLALQLACAFPGLIDGLILESTTPGIQDQTKRKSRKLLDKERSEKITAGLPAFVNGWNQSVLFQRKTPLPPDVQNRIESVQLSQNPEGLKNSLLGFGTGSMPPLHSKLAGLKVPALILAGSEDTKFVKEGHVLSDLIPDHRLSVIKDAAHRVHLDNPHDYVNAVNHFILNNS